MYILSLNVNFYLGQKEEGVEVEPTEPNITMLTAMFFFLNFLAATQVGRTAGFGSFFVCQPIIDHDGSDRLSFSWNFAQLLSYQM